MVNRVTDISRPRHGRGRCRTSYQYMALAPLLLMAFVVQGHEPAQPPPGSPAVVRSVEIEFMAGSRQPVVSIDTYGYHVRTKASRPAEAAWEPYDLQALRDDFDRLWSTGFLDDLAVDVTDVPYPNGTPGMRVTYRLQEKRRVAIVDYAGSRAIDRSVLDAALAAGGWLKPGAFFDAGTLRSAEFAIEAMLRERGHAGARVTHQVLDADGTASARVVLHLDEGGRRHVRRLTLDGNHALSDGQILSRLSGAPRGWRRLLPGQPTEYREDRFPEDADRIVQAYRDRGFIDARVGTPVTSGTSASAAGGSGVMDVTVPVTEGLRYTVDRVTFEGNAAFSGDDLAALFPVLTGRFYDEGAVRKGLQRARERYGAAGYYEFTAYPELERHNEADRLPATVSVVLRIQEGRQFFVNRLRFTGNTVTRDDVIRRELGVTEGRVFSTEALQAGLRRLNQLGYVKPIREAQQITVEKVPGAPNRLDVTVAVEEQDQRRINFGGGVSQYEGLFGNVTFATSNFLGRGETLSIAAQAGQRAHAREVSFTEPYLLGRPVTGSLGAFSRTVDYPLSSGASGYTESRTGSSWSLGRLAGPFGRIALNHTFEVVNVSIADALLSSTNTGAGSPLFNVAADAGRHVDSRITPTFVYNTVDNPILPRRGIRFTAGAQVGSRALKGEYDYLKPEVEVAWWHPLTRSTGVALRANGGWLRTFGSTTSTTLPYYVPYFLGGEQQIRGVGLRTVGPADASHRALGGNKFVLFNAEYLVDLGGPFRLVLFHDAGQAFAEAAPIRLSSLRTSAGAELRFVVPGLNLPLRFIWAVNPLRDATQPAHSFRFAIGTSF